MAAMRQQDTFPEPLDRITESVQMIPCDNAFEELAVVLAHGETALPLLREEYARASGDAKRVYAKVMAILGDSTGSARPSGPPRARDSGNRITGKQVMDFRLLYLTRLTRKDHHE